MSYLCQKSKKSRGHQLHFRDKACGNLNNLEFEKLAHLIQHGLRGFIVKNNKGKSTEVVTFYTSGSAA